MVIVLLQRPIGTEGASEKTGGFAEIGAGRDEHPIAGIAPQSRIVGRRLEAARLIVGQIGLTQQGPTHAIFETDIATYFPGVPEVKLEVVPTLLAERVGLQL